jgi:hypothetical protein
MFFKRVLIALSFLESIRLDAAPETFFGHRA